MSLLREIGLGFLNSITKYPSIPTYHTLDPTNGRLAEPAISFGEEPVILTEKIDGTNSRIIIAPNDYIIGSREELLYADGDLIHNPALGIVDATKTLADRISDIADLEAQEDDIIVFYLEAYGGNIGKAAKQYSSEGVVSTRLFDVAKIRDIEELLAKTPSQIAAWRENGGQTFCDEPTLAQFAELMEIDLAPRLVGIPEQQLPFTIESTSAFLSQFLPETKCRIDDAAGGQAEGIVLRTPTRSVIAKARFADYARTLKAPQRR